MTKDDMIFKPYPLMGGYRCIMDTKRGKISVRLGGRGTLSTPDLPYEVWYPTEDVPTPDQTADDIWNYIRHK